MKTVTVTTVLRQDLQVPDDATKQDVRIFLALQQNFRTFVGLSDQNFEIVDVDVVDEEVDI